MHYSPFLLFTLALTFASAQDSLRLQARDDCRTVTVASGDSCSALAQKCNISPNDFTKYNSDSKLCSSLQAGQQVCCSSGMLPSRKPSQGKDGSCHAYTVQAGESCSQIAASFDLKVTDLYDFNNKTTWGWAGCDHLMAKTSICLSAGSPPLPPSVDSAVCGPTKPGTTKPTDGTPLAHLNPCPLNACCDIWGQCGTTPEFCTADNGPTGNPGTATAGKNGCVSNCGVDIANKKQPAQQINVGYYESWNWDRPCLNFRVDSLDTTQYTHYHWAFADISSTDFAVSINDSFHQWDNFKSMQGVKKIVSVGGWGFSTGASTYNVLRQAMSPANSQKFAQNIVDFLNKNNLDGIDFDWEYPGAAASTGMPAGDGTDGYVYAAFLMNLRKIIPSGKSISIAAPASYWYLKTFPISLMSTQVDYIVYMTYDLHGQWDYNNKWSQDSCSGGNCLRSHVNRTETEYALAMITKAGVSTDKIVVGISSYGRAFGMTDASCNSPMCTYKGPDSAATPANCTNTPGILANAEITRLIKQGGSGLRSWYDTDSNSDMLVYGDAQWVSYLSDNTRTARKAYYKGLQFAGTADWAVDLLNFGDDDGDTGADEYGEDDTPLCDFTKKFADLDALSAASDGLNASCKSIYALETLINMLDTAYNNYTAVNDGYDKEFGYYTTYITNLVPAMIDNSFMFNTSRAYDTDKLPHIGPGFDFFDCENKNFKKGPCSTNGNENGLEQSKFDTMHMTLRDANGYNTAITKIGLLSDWVDYGTYSLSGKDCWDTHCQSREYKFDGFPIRNQSMVITNPKDIVTKALGNIPALRRSMLATLIDMKMGAWVGNSTGGVVTDPVQAYSMPVFTLMQAVDNMAQAKALGQQEEQKEEKEEEERKKNFILLIISLVFIFVPVIGEEAAAAIGLANVARAIAICGELANGALSIYDTYQHPESAFLNVLGMLFGAGTIAKAVRDGPGIAKVAKLRQGMSADQIKTLGTIFKNQDDKLQSIMKMASCKI